MIGAMSSIHTVPMRDGRAIRVRVVGARDGTPVVMLAGLGMTSAMWLPFVAPYLRRYRFYMPDYRGFGHSIDVPMRSADLFENHAHDVRDMIEHFGLRNFALVGYSLGGSTSLHFQREFGFDGVRRYLHIDQSPFVGTKTGWEFGLVGGRQPEVAERLARVRDLIDAHPGIESIALLPRSSKSTLASELAALGPLLGQGRHFGSFARVAFALPARLQRRIPLTNLAHLRVVIDSYALARHDYRESLRDCETPISVFVGMLSGLYDPRGQMSIADYAKNTRIVRFQDAGHGLVPERPRRFIRELGAFLEA